MNNSVPGKSNYCFPTPKISFMGVGKQFSKKNKQAKTTSGSKRGQNVNFAGLNSYNTKVSLTTMVKVTKFRQPGGGTIQLQTPMIGLSKTLDRKKFMIVSQPLCGLVVSTLLAIDFWLDK